LPGRLVFEFDMLEFDILLDMFEFDMVEFDMFELDMVEFDMVEFDIEEFMFDIELFVVLVFDRFILVALLTAVSPHAMPRAPKARTDESAMTFLILKAISCLLQRLTNLSQETPLPGKRRGMSQPDGYLEQAPI
jgi:hypothetical protein